MNIDTGLAIVILAVLVFYLRLIIIQRQRAKQLARRPDASRGGKKKDKSRTAPSQIRYSVISPHPVDRIIAAGGVVAILFGVLLNTRLIPLPTLQPYWWVPTAAGILAFSWAFKI